LHDIEKKTTEVLRGNSLAKNRLRLYAAITWPVGVEVTSVGKKEEAQK